LPNDASCIGGFDAAAPKISTSQAASRPVRLKLLVRVQASLEDLRDVLVILAAEVALTYTDLRAFQQQIVIAQNNLKAQKHTAGITRQRFQAGKIPAH